jgi:RNA polymerase sigma-70 factor (ECF subfamily)
MDGERNPSEGGLDRIAREYGGLVTALSLRMVEDRETAREAAQEAWIEIVKAYPGFEGRSKESTWLYSIAARAIARHARKERRLTVSFIEETMGGEEIPYPGKQGGPEEAAWVRAACDSCITGSLHCLSNRDRLAYLLYEAAGLSSEEAGKVLGMTEEALRKTTSRARDRLRGFLDGQCALYNPSGSCRCRMADKAARAGLPEEIRRLRSAIQTLSFVGACDLALSERDKIFGRICHELGAAPHQ